MTPRDKIFVYPVVNKNIQEQDYPKPYDFKKLMNEKRVEKIPIVSENN